MTTSDPRDRAAPADPHVDAAWRALSREEPPKSLDAAIMAAARREVGAKPQKIGTRETVADRRRWWPLAAAATVAAIAVGVLQLTTPDQIGAPGVDTAIVSDMPAPASRPATEMPTTPSRSEEAKPEAGSALPAEQAPTRAESPRQAPAPEPRGPAKREPASEKTPAMAEPFPAAPPPPAVAAAPASASASSIGNAAPAAQVVTSAAPSEAAPPPAMAGIAAAGRAPPSRDGGSPARVLAAPAPAPAPPLSAQRAQESAAAQPAPLAKMAAGRAADARADEARVKDRAPLPVPEWIALIRRLRDEGKSADAAKELAAFRAAHADHDKLLPSDLRDWRAPDKN
jgi:hypothetical protein